VARILILGGGSRALALSKRLHEESHAVRIVTRKPARRAEIEAAHAECFIGDPNRLATLRATVEHVTVVCWLLAGAAGDSSSLRELHGSRLEQFLRSLIDSGVRGFLYESSGTVAQGDDAVARGEQIVLRETQRNAIPLRVLRADPSDRELWPARAAEAIAGLLGCD
jgi:nucleoside-diphosphate-sugar epimerase